MILDGGHSCNADDASAGGTCQNCINGLIYFAHVVPVLAIIPEPIKSFVVVNERWRSEAITIFGDLGIQVVTGHRFLGGFLGSRSERDEYVMSKVHKWVEHVDVLAGAAVTQPQLAYAALSRSLQHEWKFLLRVVPQCGQLFQELELSLFSRFLPAMFGVEVSTVD